MTGVRIACTLGGFFLFVLLTLLYKSRCKKSSREGAPPLQMPPSTSLLSSQPLVLSMEGDERASSSNPHFRHCSPSPPDLRNYPKFYQEFRSMLPQNPAVLLTADSPTSSSGSCSLSSLHGKELTGFGENAGKRMTLLHQNTIDIHVIQPTPTMSPSGSENFSSRIGGALLKTPTPSSITSNVSSLLRMSGDSGGRERSASLISGSSSIHSNSYNPHQFTLDGLNLRYADDTESSDNIPTRASDWDSDTHSTESDSVFETLHESAALLYSKKKSAIPPPLPTLVVPDDGQRARSASMSPQYFIHRAQVHRDSNCSEPESVTDYAEMSGRGRARRSSSTQTTLSDLRQYLASNWACATPSPTTSREQSVKSQRTKRKWSVVSCTSTAPLSPAIMTAQCNSFLFLPSSPNVPEEGTLGPTRNSNPLSPSSTLNDDVSKMAVASSSSSSGVGSASAHPLVSGKNVDKPLTLLLCSRGQGGPLAHRKASIDALRTTLRLECDQVPPYSNTESGSNTTPVVPIPSTPLSPKESSPVSTTATLTP